MIKDRPAAKMASASGVNINFLSLQNQNVEARCGGGGLRPRKPNPVTPSATPCRWLKNPDERASYLISLAEESGYDPWQFRDRQNRQRVRYIFEVLAAAAEEPFVGNCELHGGFPAAVSMVIKSAPRTATRRFGWSLIFWQPKGNLGSLLISISGRNRMRPRFGRLRAAESRVGRALSS